jgi:hypothetical protein
VVEGDKERKFEQQTNSFFMAASVGITTLIFLEKMEQIPPEIEEGKKDVEADRRLAIFDELAKMVLEKIIPA